MVFGPSPLFYIVSNMRRGFLTSLVFLFGLAGLVLAAEEDPVEGEDTKIASCRIESCAG